MRCELQEWGKKDSLGDRPDMGWHMYSENDCLSVIKNGGMLETCDGQILNSELTVLDFFQEG